MKFDRKLGDGDGPDSPGRLTENCTPPARLTKKRTLHVGPHQKKHSVCERSLRLRLYVRRQGQNKADNLLRKMRSQGRIRSQPIGGRRVWEVT